MSAVAIQNDLVDILDSDATAYSTVTLYLHEAQFLADENSPPADD
jgi:hypothetical protein